MAASNVTIDDSSPLIIYDPANDWTHPAGSDAQAYINSTYSSSSVEGATAKFSFNGTGFWVLGAKKASYGEYLLMLDGEVQEYANATAATAEYAQVLGSATGLTDGAHTVVLMAAGEGSVDIDAIVYETTDGQESGTSTQTASAASGSQTVNRVTANPNAVSNPNDPFSGQNGPPSNGQPNGSSNGQPPFNGQGNGQQSTAGQSNGNAQATGQQQGAQSSAQATSQSSTADPTGSSTSSSSAPVSSISQAVPANGSQIAGASQPSKGLIIGITVGAAIGLLLLIALIALLLRRRRRRDARRRRMTAGLPSPTLPLQDPEKYASHYFFGGYGTGGGGGNSNRNTKRSNSLREMYLSAQAFPQTQTSTRPMSQSSASSYSQVTDQSRSLASEHGMAGTGEVEPMMPAVMRDSVYSRPSSRSSSRSSGDSATLGREEGYYNPPSAYPSSNSNSRPNRPPRPPELRLSPV